MSVATNIPAFAASATGRVRRVDGRPDLVGPLLEPQLVSAAADAELGLRHIPGGGLQQARRTRGRDPPHGERGPVFDPERVAHGAAGLVHLHQHARHVVSEDLPPQVQLERNAQSVKDGTDRQIRGYLGDAAPSGIA